MSTSSAGLPAAASFLFKLPRDWVGLSPQLLEVIFSTEVMKENKKPLRALESAHPGHRSQMAACVALSSRGMLLSGNQELRSWLQYLAAAVFATVFG